MFNMTKVKLKLVSDPEMYIFFGRGTRGGVFCISNEKSKASSKCLKPYDPKQESKHIKCLDAIDLYVYLMSKFFPISGFKWIDPKELDQNKYTSNSSKGCVLENDLKYPLAPDKIEIKREMLSDYQLKNADLYSIPIVNVKKLVSNFFDKDSL